jgi:tRNA pseudouridine38-40 synthase
MRVVLGVSYRGQGYRGWQSQADGCTIQDALESALQKFADRPVRTHCAGRTDAGVHALNQVVHFDTEAVRPDNAWVRAVNRYLPSDIAIQWCRFRDDGFHARFSALGRRYTYVLLESPVRPSIEARSAGWSFRALDGARLRAAARILLGEHDFSAFRSSECQARSPVKTIRAIQISRRAAYWRFDFDANAYLHHMVRNLMGALVAVGNGSRRVEWLASVLASGRRELGAPTFPADGLYFAGPYYDPSQDIPQFTPAMDWLP